MDPKDFLAKYIQIFSQQELVSGDEDSSARVLLLPERHFRHNNYRESYLDTLSRSELLRLIQTLHIIQNDQRLTSQKFISYVQDLRNQVAHQQGEIEELNAEVAEREKEIECLKTQVAENQQQKGEIEQLKFNLWSLYASTSWKITAPIRFISRISRKILVRMFLSRQSDASQLKSGYDTTPLSGSSTASTASTAAGSQGAGSGGLADSTMSVALDRGFIEYLATQFQPDEKYFLPLDDEVAAAEARCVKLIAFYLPQFHPIPENDCAWGKGFTEWTNVTRALPQFEGHYQPHLPGELGFYDLRLPDILLRQIELARQYGIYGFCFHFYWFAGKRLLEKPLDLFLSNKAIDLPFCICWANENWTRRWDGYDTDTIIAQHHTPESDFQFIIDVSPILIDRRYVRIGGRPLLMIYRPQLIPNITETVQIWRDYCRRQGIGDPYLVMAQVFGAEDPRLYGFDAAVEFPPHKVTSEAPSIVSELKLFNPEYSGHAYDYRFMVAESKSRTVSEFPLFRGVSPSWDNEARRPGQGHVAAYATPLLYEEWLTNACAYASSHSACNTPAAVPEGIVFINAWNEWAEGTHLEPDRRFGYANLAATRRTVNKFVSKSVHFVSSLDLGERFQRRHDVAVILHLFYPELWNEIIGYLRNLGESFDFFVSVPECLDEPVECVITESFSQARVFRMPNRGRDMLPFIEVFSRIADAGYRAILKLHSKKSLHRQDGAIWRQDIYGKLMGAREMVYSILQAFEILPTLGVVCPQGHLQPMSSYIASNLQALNCLIRELGSLEAIEDTPHFPAGSMFWFRPEALYPLVKNLALSAEKFESETGQVDGTLAHALERFIVVAARYQGYFALETDLAIRLGQSKRSDLTKVLREVRQFQLDQIKCASAQAAYPFAETEERVGGFSSNGNLTNTINREPA